MKRRTMWMLTVCGMVFMGAVPAAEADFLSDLLANPPQAPYADRQEGVAEAGDKPVFGKNRAADSEARLQNRTALITPQGTRLQGRGSTRLAPRASAAVSRSRVVKRAITGQAARTDLRVASAPSSPRPTRVASRPAPVAQTGQAYRQHRSRAIQPPLTTPHIQPPQTVYAPGYQQPAYAAAPNPYQGYAYQGWAAANNPAACGPGRA